MSSVGGNETVLQVGDTVRVLRVPPEVDRLMPEETREIFRRCVGQVLCIDSFDDYGHLELNVLDDGSQAPNGCHHTIWIEPECVEGPLTASRTA